MLCHGVYLIPTFSIYCLFFVALLIFKRARKQSKSAGYNSSLEKKSLKTQKKNEQKLMTKRTFLGYL